MLPPDSENQAEDRRVELHVIVHVHVVKGEACCPEGVELGADLLLELTPGRGKNEIAESRPHEAVPEPPLPAHQGRDCGRWKNRPAPREDKVQPHPQVRQPPRPQDGVARGWGADHQARRGEDPPQVGLLDRLVDGNGETEIVAGEDDLYQAPLARVERNRRNSAPSRSLRLNT